MQCLSYYREEIRSCALVEISTVLKLKLNMYRKSTAHNLYVHCLVQYRALYSVHSAISGDKKRIKAHNSVLATKR